MGDIILCRAISAEDENLIKAAERFTKLCTKEWTGQVSHTALATLSKSKFNKPPTIPFTEDVQLLHKYLEGKLADAIENLKEHQSPQAYAELARVTLAQIILFNRRRAGEVSKMTLESFKKRDQTDLHSDLAASLSRFEQKLARHFSRVEIMGKRGRKVAVSLNPDVVSATMLLTEKRETCNVHKDNPFLFGRPQCPSTSYYRGQDCIRIFAQMSGAKNPENLRSTHLRKHIATLSQILNLKNNELDQLANFLGHDIRVHRDFYRLPEATIEVAKISKLLLAVEKGTLGDFQRKSLDEIEIEGQKKPCVSESVVTSSKATPLGQRESLNIGPTARPTDDAISTALHHTALTHLDTKDSYIRMLFIDFSSAFNNTVIPQQLILKLDQLGINTSLCNWLLDFLTGRPQAVHGSAEEHIQHHTTLNTGAPQGCVLSPLLFTLLTHDCTPSFAQLQPPSSSSQMTQLCHLRTLPSPTWTRGTHM
ncbi:hypothetical protein L3Q82_010889 [Scortum barcoo]|uniref:Uncharacterized protein n=1 Tax=Scortum barcoo TaxID=214431 RepID=A0ACB8W9W1_9TELE|nr:hypothetical protein L3Q82_010889 [Scortum barcoo]